MNDRATACRLLRQLREQRGWSWADQARALRAIAERLGMGAASKTGRSAASALTVSIPER
jgi:transcriptional regulator with XRE-family HTH domain